MKSIANKTLYSLGGAFKTIGKEIGHLYNILSYIIIRATGTSITLNNTVPGRMNIELGTSELEQETTTGKNLCKPNTTSTGSSNGITRTTNNDGSVTFSGTATANAYFRISDYLTLESNTEYTTYNANGVLPSGVTLYYNDNENIGQTYSGTNISPGNTLKAYTTGTVTGTVSIAFLISSGTTINATLKPMLVKGTYTASNIPAYEPYTGGIPAPNPQYPMPIHTISGNNKVIVCNKNLMSLGTQQNGYVDAGTLLFQDGSGGIGTAATKSVGYYFKTSQLPNTITISDVNGNRMNVCYFNEIPTYQSQCLLRSASNDNPRTINIDKTYKYVHIQFSYNDENVSNIQVESGSTKTDFVTSTSQEANINLGDIEYCEIGDYKDEFVRDNEGNWGIRKNIGKVVLDGTENWGSVSNNRITTTLSAPAGDGWSSVICKCNYLKAVYQSMMPTTTQENIICTSVNSVYIRLTSNDTLSSITSWLGTAKPKLYYALATPKYTPITGTLAEQLENIYQYLLSYKGQTNISQINNDLPFELNVSARGKE